MCLKSLGVCFELDSSSNPIVLTYKIIKLSSKAASNRITYMCT